MQGASLTYVTFKEGSLYRGKQVNAQAKCCVKYNERNNAVRIQQQKMKKCKYCSSLDASFSHKK